MTTHGPDLKLLFMLVCIPNRQVALDILQMSRSDFKVSPHSPLGPTNRLRQFGPVI